MQKVPEGWERSQVVELCTLGRGRVISEKEIVQSEGIYPVFSSQSMNNGEMGRINSFDFEGEYVTWTTDGAYAGTVFYRNGRFNCTNVCGTLKLKDPNFSHKLLAYILSTQAKRHVSYVGNPKLMNGVMAKIQILFPSEPSEQRAIVEILATCDEAIEKTDAKIEKLKRIKQGLMQDLFRYGIDEKGRMRSEKTYRFKDSPLGRIPEEWEVIPLEDFTSKEKFAIVDGPFGSNLKIVHYRESGRMVIQSGFVTTGKFIAESYLYVDESKFRAEIRSKVAPGDIVMAKIGAQCVNGGAKPRRG